MHTLSRAAVVALLLVALRSAPCSASAWTALDRVNFYYGANCTAGSPSMAISPSTHLPYVVYDVVWNSSNANDRVIGFSKPTLVGRTIDWSGARSHPTEVSARGAKHVSPVMAIGSKNGQERIYVFWWDHLASEDMMYSRSVDGGATWSGATNVSGSGKVASGHWDAAADDQGNLYVVWSDWTGNADANGLDVWFRKFNGTTEAWETKKRLESNGGTKSTFPRIVRQSNGRLHIAWADRLADPQYLSYCTSGDGGATFTPRQTVFYADSTPDFLGDLQGCALTVLSDGTVMAAGPTNKRGYISPAPLYYAIKPPDANWGARIHVPQADPACANPYMTRDSTGRVFMSWLNMNLTVWDIYYQEYTGSGWTAATNTTRDGLWKGYAGGHMEADTANNYLYVATDIKSADLGHQIFFTYCDLLSSLLPAASFSAVPGDGKMKLTWSVPNDPAIRGVKIVYRTDRSPQSPTDGSVVVDKSCGYNISDTFTHTGLANDVTCFYAVYTRDGGTGYSTPVLASAAPRHYALGEAKKLPDGSQIALDGRIVTAVFSGDGCIYVEEPDRACGIRVATTQTGLAVGDVVSFSGAAASRVLSGHVAERQINAPVVSQATSPPTNSPLSPIAMSCRAVGGGAAGPVPGVQGGYGANNMGLLVRIAGRITHTISSYLYIDDGTDIADTNGYASVMVRCPGDPTMPPKSLREGDVVTAAGVVEGSVPSAPGWTANRRYLHTRDWNDIVLVWRP